MHRDWDQVTDVAHCFGQMLGAATDKLVELGGLAPGHKVLDIGCGVGGVARRAAARVARKGGRVVGVDASQRMIETARRWHEGAASLEFAVRDATTPITPPNTVDAAYCSFVLPFAEDPRALLQSTLASLVPGGRLAVMGIADHEHNDFILAMADAGGDTVARALQLGNPDTLGHLLEDAGFQQVRTKRIRALATVTDPAAYWSAVRGLFGIASPAMPPSLQLGPGARLPLSIVMALGHKKDPSAPEQIQIRSGEEVVALARKRCREIGPLSIKQSFKREQVTYVDVRDPSTRTSQIRGSHAIERHDLERRMPGLVADPAALIVVYSKDGQHGALAAEQLGAMGYINVWNLQGGIDAWQYVGMKVEPV